VTRASDLHVLLAGGGSGGHVFPALAVGEELSARGCAVSFAGAAGGMEARLVPQRGIPFHPLRARPLVGVGWAGKVRALATLALSSLGGARLLRRLGVRVVLGTGGYVSAPAVLGARLLRRPALLLEPNARAGLANRQLGRFASGAAVAFPRAARDLACPVRTTGVPVRREFFDVPEEPEGDGLRLLVLGGSQGARSLNLAVVGALLGSDGGGRGGAGLLERRPELTVVHQTGAALLDETREAYARGGVLGEGNGWGRLRVVPFIDDVAGAMGRSHLVVSRAGAITVAEIAAAGRASVLVPLALAEGHQADNARALDEAGAARTVSEVPAGSDGEGGPDDLPGALASCLDELLADRSRLREMAGAARALARRDAASAIADWIVELGGGAA
jgi:UDP-N-acetylglucosamine--N-acetylmuramyl-(pentapeptide) pyrophosphoryl-undecaprenol N-acetylglucosamine transferase